MRVQIWTAALLAALGFSLRAPAAPIQLVAAAGQGSTSTPASLFQRLSLPSFLVPSSSVTSINPSMPSIYNAPAYSSSAPIPMGSNGAPTMAYFQQFGLSARPRPSDRGCHTGSRRTESSFFDLMIRFYTILCG